MAEPRHFTTEDAVLVCIFRSQRDVTRAAGEVLAGDRRSDIVEAEAGGRFRDLTADLQASYDWLQTQDQVTPDKIGSIGFCMGGRIVYLAAAAIPAFKAAVAYYPGNTFRAWGRDLPSPFERTAEIHCPLQGHFGADDANPSPQDVGKLDAELAKFNKPHEFYSYSNAGHAFMDSTKQSYRRDADAASWPRTLGFLARHLGA